MANPSKANPLPHFELKECKSKHDLLERQVVRVKEGARPMAFMDMPVLVRDEYVVLACSCDELKPDEKYVVVRSNEGRATYKILESQLEDVSFQRRLRIVMEAMGLNNREELEKFLNG